MLLDSHLQVSGHLRAAHAQATATVASRLRDLYETKTAYRVYHGSTNSTRPSTHSKRNIVDTRGLCRVLHVDAHENVALVEPNVSMINLARATLNNGRVPLVVMEFPEITAGG